MFICLKELTTFKEQIKEIGIIVVIMAKLKLNTQTINYLLCIEVVCVNFVFFGSILNH